MSKNIFVYGDWETLGQPTHIGVLNVDLLKGKEIWKQSCGAQVPCSICTIANNPKILYYENEEKK